MSDKIILLVEDSPDDEALMLRALRKHNFTDEVVVTHDGTEALDYLFAIGKYTGRDAKLMPQLIILDLKLPKIDGLEVLKSVRANALTAIIPVVVFTSSNEERDITTSYSLGANSYICKPVDFNQFSEAVRKLGEYWLTLNVFVNIGESYVS